MSLTNIQIRLNQDEEKTYTLFKKYSMTPFSTFAKRKMQEYVMQHAKGEKKQETLAPEPKKSEKKINQAQRIEDAITKARFNDNLKLYKRHGALPPPDFWAMWADVLESNADDLKEGAGY